MSFQECDLENLIIDAIKGKGYTYAHGDTLRREYDNVLLEDDLTAFLKKRYAGKPEFGEILIYLLQEIVLLQGGKNVEVRCDQELLGLPGWKRIIYPAWATGYGKGTFC